jgi:hypothetical protein
MASLFHRPRMHASAGPSGDTAPDAPAAQAHATAVVAANGMATARAHAAAVVSTPGSPTAMAHAAAVGARFDEVWDAAYRAINEMYDATKMLKDIAANNYMQSADNMCILGVYSMHAIKLKTLLSFA